MAAAASRVAFHAATRLRGARVDRVDEAVGEQSQPGLDLRLQDGAELLARRKAGRARILTGEGREHRPRS